MSQTDLNTLFPGYKFYVNSLTGKYVIIHPDGEICEYAEKSFDIAVKGLQESWKRHI